METAYAATTTGQTFFNYERMGAGFQKWGNWAARVGVVLHEVFHHTPENIKTRSDEQGPMYPGGQGRQYETDAYLFQSNMGFPVNAWRSPNEEESP